jgi:hypothetical protein
MDLAHDVAPLDDAVARTPAPTTELEQELPGILRAGTAGVSAPGPIDRRSILRLQRSAGNRAVGTLLRSAAPPARAAIARGPVIQRKTNFWGDEELEPTPEEPIPNDQETPTLQFPQNDAEAVRNEPCFGPEAQTMITDGVMHADLASAALTKMPPDIAEAVAEISEAQVQWNQTQGSPEPGEGAMKGARDKIDGAQERIAIYVVPVNDMLNATATATEEAAADAKTAANMETENGPDGEPAETCFEDQQQSLIRAAAEEAEKGAALLDARPPDYDKAITTIRGAADKLEAIGGRPPGQVKLKEAIAKLRRVTDALEAYLTPVAKVLADAAKDIQAASSAASDAKDMSIRGEFAPKPNEPGQ